MTTSNTTAAVVCYFCIVEADVRVLLGA